MVLRRGPPAVSHKMNFRRVMYTTGLQGYAFSQLVAQVT
jgi:hypothetical protein